MYTSGIHLVFYLVTVFSLNFSSASEGPFIANKAKKYVPEVHFPGGRGLVECMGNLGAMFSETSLLILRPYLCKPALVTFTHQFKMTDSNNFALCSMFSF